MLVCAFVNEIEENNCFQLTCIFVCLCVFPFVAYCKKVGTDQESVRFLFDGQRVRAEQTPEEVSSNIMLISFLLYLVYLLYLFVCVNIYMS